jgi:hypothetical protein
MAEVTILQEHRKDVVKQSLPPMENTAATLEKMMHLVRAIDEQEARDAAKKKIEPQRAQSPQTESTLSSSPRSDDASKLPNDFKRDKSEKERNRRSHLNELFTELGTLLGVRGKNKAQVLEDAKIFIEKHNSKMNGRA